MVKCEFHDEGFKALHDRLTEIQNDLKSGNGEFRELEKSKLSWKVFTWIIGFLMVMWLAVNGVMWNSVSSTGRIMIHLDKKISLHLGEKPSEINENH